MTDREESEVVRRRVLISGRVQGVFFRASCAEEAEREGVAGWVRNLPDGRVEAAFEGSRSAVDRMIAWCHEGPPSAHVSDVDIETEKPMGHARFTVC